MEARGATPATQGARRLTTETKHAFKTTEFWVYVIAVLAVLIAGTVDDAEGTEFGADKVWLFVTLLTIGYMVSRGISKAGSRDPYWDQPGSESSGGGLGDRVKAAAQVLTEGEESSSQPTQQAPGHRPSEGNRF